MKQIFTITTLILYIIDFIILEINRKNEKTNKESYKKTTETKELKKWELFSNIIIVVLFTFLILLLLNQSKLLSMSFDLIFIVGGIIIYTFILINILLKGKKEDINRKELQTLILIPLLISSINSIFESGGYTWSIFSNDTMEMFIIKNTIKYFIVVFFISIDVFILLREIRQYLISKSKKNYKEKEIPSIWKHEYTNAKRKKGFCFLIGYIKDVMILVYTIFRYLINVFFINIIKFVCIVLTKILKRITQNFSMYVIIVKTFNISIIISLLITFQKLQQNYKGSNDIELYSIIITAIIIPSILEVVGNLKKN